MAGKSKRTVVSISERKLLTALKTVEPAVFEVWEQYDLNTVINTLQYLTAKGIEYSKGLTAEDKKRILGEAKEKLDIFSRVIRKYKSSKSKN